MLTSEDWKNVLESMIERKTEGSLAKICNEVGWPSRSAVLDVLVSDYFQAKPIKKIKDIPVPSSSVIPVPKNRVAFWSMLSKKYQFTLGDFEGKKFPFWLLKEQLKEPLCGVIGQSTSEDVQQWCLQPSDIKVVGSGTSKYSLSVLEALVYTNQTDILKEVIKRYPNAPHQVGHFQRHLMFYAQSPEMVGFLLDQKVSYHQVDQSEQTVSQYWKALPLFSDMMDVASARGVVDVKSTLVSKIASLLPSLTPEENKELSDATKNIQTWTWTGEVHGIARTWTLPEIWRFTELMACLDKVRPSGVEYQYPHGELTVAYSPIQVIQRLKKIHELFPQISQAVHEAPLSSFTQVLTYLMGFPLDAKSPMLFDQDPEKAMSLSNPTLTSASLMAVAEKFLSAVPVKDRDVFNKHMLLMMSQPWFESHALSVKRNAYVSRWTLPLSKGGYATPALAEAMTKSPQGQSLRSRWVAYSYQLALYSRYGKNGSDLPFLSTTKQSDPSWSDTVYLALGVCATDRGFLPNFQKTLARELADSDVSLPHIPSRWVKFYEPDLASVLHNRELKEKLSARIQKKDTAPKRKI